MINMRVCYNYGEILDTFTKMYIDSVPTLIWQNIGGKKVISSAQVTDIDYENKRLELTANSAKSFRSFSKGLTFYLRGTLKSILFKNESVMSCNGRRLVISIPTEVRMYEQRINPRLQLDSFAKLETKLIKNSDDFSRRKDFVFLLNNISSNGACFKVISTSAKYFYKGDIIKIEKILGYRNFEINVNGEIVYISKKEDQRGQAYWIMGVQFTEPLDEKVVSEVFDFAKKLKIMGAA